MQQNEFDARFRVVTVFILCVAIAFFIIVIILIICTFHISVLMVSVWPIEAEYSATEGVHLAH
jgi:hypothetical protein